MPEETKSLLEIPDITIDLPERSTKGHMKRQRKMARFMSNYMRTAADVKNLQDNTNGDRDFVGIADALERYEKALDDLLEYFALFVIEPSEHDDKIEALEELSQEHYELLSEAIMNPSSLEGDDENPTESQEKSEEK